MSNAVKTFEKIYHRSTPPQDRIKLLCDISNRVQVDITNPARRYYRSGPLMVRTADMYLKDGSYEDAFVMYMKFITLFVEKIRQHPDLKSVPGEDVALIKQSLKDVMSKAEELKIKLLKKYTADHNHYLIQKSKDEELEEQLRQEEEQRLTEYKAAAVAANTNSNSPSSEIRPSYSPKTDNAIKPVPYLPDDFLVYELPADTETRTSHDDCTSVTKPGVDRSTKPQTNTFKDRPYGSALRTVIIPSRMLQTFLVLAQKNTSNNVETCGILAGKLKQNKLVITHLLIPKQYGTSDSCTTDNEEDIFNYQNEYELITLGWIHTHPSQTAFLSSVDLHTHYSYQLMLSEAIAIVCAPRYNETGFFNLTPHYGLNFIANCRQTGFHPHPSDPPLFQDVDHCEVDENAAVEVVDLRS